MSFLILFVQVCLILLLLVAGFFFAFSCAGCSLELSLLCALAALVGVQRASYGGVLCSPFALPVLFVPWLASVAALAAALHLSVCFGRSLSSFLCKLAFSAGCRFRLGFCLCFFFLAFVAFVAALAAALRLSCVH